MLPVCSQAAAGGVLALSCLPATSLDLGASGAGAGVDVNVGTNVGTGGGTGGGGADGGMEGNMDGGMGARDEADACTGVSYAGWCWCPSWG